MGYARAGFEVLGVDLHPQPHYPFEFVQADALEFPLEGFDAIHASPPCQRFSPISRYQRVAESYPDLIAPTRARLKSAGVPAVLENVPEAPVRADVTLCGRYFGLPIFRHRAFELIGWEVRESPACPGHVDGTPRQSWSGYNRLPGILTIVGHTFSLRDGRIAMEMPWAGSREELAEAIPPAYTQWLGLMLRAELERREVSRVA